MFIIIYKNVSSSFPCTYPMNRYFAQSCSEFGPDSIAANPSVFPTFFLVLTSESVDHIQFSESSIIFTQSFLSPIRILRCRYTLCACVSGCSTSCFFVECSQCEISTALPIVHVAENVVNKLAKKNQKQWFLLWYKTDFAFMQTSQLGDSCAFCMVCHCDINISHGGQNNNTACKVFKTCRIQKLRNRVVCN